MQGYTFRFTLRPPAGDPLAVKRVAQMSMLGNILAYWNNAELTMEIVVKKLLGLTLEQTCIICGPLGGGAKTEMVTALLKGKPEWVDFLASIKDFQGRVSRNWLAHGFIIFDDVNGPWDIVQREVKNGLRIKSKKLMGVVDEDFQPAFDKFMQLSGVTGDELHEYATSIRSLARDRKKEVARQNWTVR